MQNQHHPEDHKRLVIFFVLAAIIMGLSYFFITKPQMDKAREQQGVVTAAENKNMSPAKIEAQEKLLDVAQVVKDTSRIAIDTPELSGSFSPTGLRIDDIEFKNYYTTLKNDERVRLLAPNNTKQSYFAEIGLMPDDTNIAVPTQKTVWKKISGDKLTPATPVTLEWNNGAGITFRRVVSIDENYVMTIEQSIVNNTKAPVTFYPYASIAQSHHIPLKGEKITFEDQPSSVQHIGPLGYLNEKLQEESYKDVQKDKPFEYSDTNGWLGITSKYWLVALLPNKDDSFDARFSHQIGSLKQDIYQTDLREKPLTIAPNETGKTQMRLFTGAKKLDLLNHYSKTLNVPKLDLSVDFGVLYILTKPLYHFLSYLGNFFRDHYHTPVSFGLALLTLTILLRAVTFPLQTKSYRSMNKMKDLAPKLQELKEKFADDKTKYQQEVFALYKKDKINPASGCLPMLIQIPIFFALYKTIYIALDMRHAPFFGWIHDLSAPDPTNIINLFGLLPFNTSSFIMIGAWPILYALTMFTQQRLNPQPDDPVQKQVFAFMPWMFMFIFAKLPAGLVIYYTWSNLLGILQQYTLRKMHPPAVKAKK
jgi:YidC/Oxa1 family membrane protein insertase